MGFQSTPSARRATCKFEGDKQPAIISIHALREEGDVNDLSRLVEQFQFQSTPSARRATRKGVFITASAQFQSTPSARRATLQIIEGG